MRCLSTGVSAVLGVFMAGAVFAEPLGLPPVPIPADNPQTPAKIALGDKLFHDQRFSSTGKVSCATCHARARLSPIARSRCPKASTSSPARAMPPP